MWWHSFWGPLIIFSGASLSWLGPQAGLGNTHPYGWEKTETWVLRTSPLWGKVSLVPWLWEHVASRTDMLSDAHATRYQDWCDVCTPHAASGSLKRPLLMKFALH